MLEMNRVEELIKERVQEPVFVVELELTGDDRGRVLRLVLDTDDGIRVGVLTGLARELGHALDEGEILPFAYRLEVISPGLDRNLDHPRLLAKAVGRKVKVRWTQEDDENKVSRGVLKAVSETQIELEHKGQKEVIQREQSTRINYWLEW
jgi:ribosome maturation factor RimP